MLLEGQNLKKYFYPSGQGLVRAVDGVSLSVLKGESLGIVGESGCGKTTLVKIILGLVAPDAGRVLWEGREVWGQAARERNFRRRVRMVFQDPYASLDPRFSVAQSLCEALCLEDRMSLSAQKKKMGKVLKSVGLSPDVLPRFPHEFSGGERQRIAIARALMTDPALLILDEAVSALDVLIQKEILDLLWGLQRSEGITQIFVSHNVAAVRKIAQKIVVMYQGRIVEYGPAEAVFHRPQHAYTRRLLEAAICYRVDGAGDIILAPEARLREVGQAHWVLS